MKISPTLLAAVLSLACLAAPARAEEPKPITITITPEMQKLFAQLLKLVQAMKLETDALLDPETEESTEPNAGQEAKQPALDSVGRLRTGSLRTGGLQPSAGLDGQGAKGGSSRASAEEWRMLFPLRQDRR